LPSLPKHRVIIDCDPGHDDMAAIILAAWHPAIALEAITTVCGNASLENTTRNALRIVEALRIDVPVYRGALHPLLHEYDFPAAHHGTTGLDSAGKPLPPPTRRVEPTAAAEEIIRRVEANPGKITLCPVGPMTNVAIALSLRPDLATEIKEIAFMGGGLGFGNITAAAEFNIWADAEAASIVFRSGAKLTMFGLNVTHQTLLRRADIAAFRARSPSKRNPLADILEFYCGAHYKFAGAARPGAPLHDPCTIAYLIDPSIFTWENLPGEVVTEEGPTYGMTLIDTRHRAPRRDKRVRNVKVAMTADQERFSELMVPALVWAAGRIEATKEGGRSKRPSIGRTGKEARK